jgi:hypothetical protein
LVLDDEVERVLNSSRLDECFGARFERVRSSSGRLIVVPAA